MSIAVARLHRLLAAECPTEIGPLVGPIFVIRSYGSWGTRMEDHNTMLLDKGCGNVFL